MEKKGAKRGIYIITFFIILLFLISLVSAGFSDFIKSITGKAGQQPQDVSIKVKGTNPAQIVYVSPIPDTNPNEAAVQSVTFEVHMYDKDGVKDLNHTSVSANVSLSGETTRFSDICNRQFPDAGQKTANYSCSINMWYWDGASTNWNINVKGKDIGNGSWVYNTSTTFQYNPLLSMEISPVELDWPDIIPEETNRTPGNYTIVNNTGNYKGNITIIAIDLLGEENSSEAIYAENFTVGNSTGAEKPECDVNPLINSKLMNKSSNPDGVQIVNSDSNPGNLSAGDGSGQEILYYCIPQVPPISSQVYSTKTGGSWTILY